jgi:hypothetical protein
MKHPAGIDADGVFRVRNHGSGVAGFWLRVGERFGAEFVEGNAFREGAQREAFVQTGVDAQEDSAGGFWSAWRFGRGFLRGFQVGEVLIHDAAEFLVDLGLIGAMDATEEESRATADITAVLVTPQDEFDVLVGGFAHGN